MAEHALGQSMAGRHVLGHKHRQEVRVYKCNFCNWHHLTSKPDHKMAANYDLRKMAKVK